MLYNNRKTTQRRDKRLNTSRAGRHTTRKRTKPTIRTGRLAGKERKMNRKDERVNMIKAAAVLLLRLWAQGKWEKPRFNWIVFADRKKS